MSRYVTIRLTIAQAQAACNAADLIRDDYEAGGSNVREAALYERTSHAIAAAIADQARGRRRRRRRGSKRGIPNVFDDLFASATP